MLWSDRIGTTGLKRRWRKEQEPDIALSHGDAGVFGAFSRQGTREVAERRIRRLFLSPTSSCGFGADSTGRLRGDAAPFSPEDSDLGYGRNAGGDHKRAALYCYKNHKAYQPFNVYWAEQGLMLFSEFRDGNVPADYDLLRPFKQALELVPAE